MLPQGAFPCWVGCLTPHPVLAHQERSAHQEGSAQGFRAWDRVLNPSPSAHRGCRFLSVLMYHRAVGGFSAWTWGLPDSETYIC